MAKIECVGANSASMRSNCEEDDFIAVYDDDVLLTGAGYELKNIYQVANVTAAEVCAKFSELMPERKQAFRLSEGSKWIHEQPEELETWKNSEGKWCELVEDPKYKISLANLSIQDKADLADEKVLGVLTLSVLGKCQEKIHLNENNNVEIDDLNEVIK